LTGASVIEVFVDGTNLNYRPAGVEDVATDELVIH
jgi:hypothetical protein